MADRTKQRLREGERDGTATSVSEQADFMTLALIDYGAGNLHSVENALKAVGSPVLVTDDATHVARADRIVLPGVGSFAACMQGLSALPDMVETMERRVLEHGVPFLGICVGMQLMAEEGLEQGRHRGLGWVPGTVEPLQPSQRVKVPHMGWNEVQPVDGETLVAAGEAYFLHGYAFRGRGAVCATTDHGSPVTAAVRTGTAIGVQFHPEKSQGYGLAFLKRFLEWRP